MAHEVFIGYGVSDQSVADAVCTRLESVHHIQCWVAPRDVPPGVPLAQARIDALDQSKIMVAVVGSSDIASTQMEREVERAVQRGINVIPLRWSSTTPAGAPAMGTAHWLEALSTQVNIEVNRVAERVAALLGASKEAPPPAVQSRSSWEIPALVGIAIVVVGFVVGLWLRTQSPAPADQALTAPTQAEQADASTAQAVPQSAIGAQPAAAPDAASAASPTPQEPIVGGANGASPDAGQGAPRATSDAAVTNTSAARRVERVEPSPAVAAVEPQSPSAPARTAERPATDAAGQRRPAVESAASASGPLGTLVIDFVNTYPDGTMEVEIDGRREWTEKLRPGQPVGVFSRLLLQRASSQMGSSLKVSPGDHQVTVTMLNGEGEVRDTGTTVLHVDVSRPVTLRIRVTRFRNRLLLESSAG